MSGGDEMSERESTRRELLKKTMYVPPAILTLAALPSFASAGSGSDASAVERGDREERRRTGNWWRDVLGLFGIN
jgi:hypothetical protein